MMVSRYNNPRRYVPVVTRLVMVMHPQAKEDFERGIAANLGAVQKAHWENQAEKVGGKNICV